MSDDEFYRKILDVMKTFYRQRTALISILNGEAVKGTSLENWEPVYQVLQNEPEITAQADRLFADFYASVSNGERDAGHIKVVSEDGVKWKPN